MASVGEMLLGRLIDRSHLMDPYMINAEAADAVEMIGGRDLMMYLVDYGQRQLMPIAGSDQEEPLDIEGTVAGKAFVSGDLIDVEIDGRHRVWAPLIDGADRVGVVGLTLDGIDDDLRRLCLRFASLLTQFMITKGAYTDLYERTARSQQMTVAAELQWRQIPPLTFTTRRVAVAGILEPAYGIGGDAFDYSHNDDVTDLVILDSMGHGLTAAWPASLTLATLRQCRTQGLGLIESYQRAGEMIRETFDSEHFITAQLGRLHCLTGELTWINAGHPAPLLVREGKVIGQLSCGPSLPLRLGGEVREVASTRLQPWDRVLFFTDGVIEGHVRGNEPFGLERLADLLSAVTLAGNGPAETVRRLAHAVQAHHRHHLSDDFTMLSLEYRLSDGEVEGAPNSYRLRSQGSI